MKYDDVFTSMIEPYYMAANDNMQYAILRINKMKLIYRTEPFHIEFDYCTNNEKFFDETAFNYGNWKGHLSLDVNILEMTAKEINILIKTVNKAEKSDRVLNEITCLISYQIDCLLWFLQSIIKVKAEIKDNYNYCRDDMLKELKKIFDKNKKHLNKLEKTLQRFEDMKGRMHNV